MKVTRGRKFYYHNQLSIVIFDLLSDVLIWLAIKAYKEA